MSASRLIGAAKGVSEIIGVVMVLMMTLTMSSLTYTYIGTVYAQATRPIEAIDSYCIGGNITFVIRNGGSSDLNGNSLTCYPISQTCSTGCTVPSSVTPGGAGTVTIGGCTSGRAHTWRLRGPSNVVELYAYCP